jgi:hypothetical protein
MMSRMQGVLIASRNACWGPIDNHDVAPGIRFLLGNEDRRCKGGKKQKNKCSKATIISIRNNPY